MRIDFPLKRGTFRKGVLCKGVYLSGGRRELDRRMRQTSPHEKDLSGEM
jgi:hypothetical protein